MIKMGKITLALAACLASAGTVAAASPSVDTLLRRPKLVVGIVIDQMRHEYLYRYYPKFGAGGFRRLMREGFSVEDARYDYVPTYTGPGHASIYTGAPPSEHGIIGNRWYDRSLKEEVNCVGDPRYVAVGSTTAKGAVSPWRLIPTTLSDELKIATQRRARVIGVSFKDRGAVLPAGHIADGAYWYDPTTGHFITSSYYADALPGWLRRFNALNLSKAYLDSVWRPVYPLARYEESGPDSSAYETMGNRIKPVFPYRLSALQDQKKALAMLPAMPFGNDLLTRLALAAIEGNRLGQDRWTDLLAISYSSTDILGHAVGPNAVELEDMYIRLDKNIEQLLNRLDTLVGRGNYLLFLTSDHGVADVEGYARALRIAPREEPSLDIEKQARDALATSPLDEGDAIEKTSGHQLYLKPRFRYPQAVDAPPGDRALPSRIAQRLLQHPAVAAVFTREDLNGACFDEAGMRGRVRRGAHAKRSGDITVVPAPFRTGMLQGTTHGTGYTYDTHVPLLFYGFGIRPGRTFHKHSITDIAPTLSMLLHIKMPSGATGHPIAELWSQ